MDEVTGPMAPKRWRPRRWLYLFAPLAVIALVIGAIAVGTRLTEDDGDGDTNVDGCLEEARTQDDVDTCVIGERLDDIGGDEYVDCLNDLADDPAMDGDECGALLTP